MRLAFVLAVACSAPATSTPLAVPVLPDVPFAMLDRDQRAQFMEQRVVPVMAPLFRAHDPARHAAFGCKTCHGDSRDHAMPNAALPRLGENNDPVDVEWMTTTIKPAMAKLLDDPALDCLRCHVRDPQ
ncbi:MAG: hypothetical protein M4D80_06955 [Myxococcota bacterium]|nr:hypothetical protein [Myxococcota bacterium]